MVKIILGILLLLFSELVFAGAWVQPVGKSLLISTMQWYQSCDYWDKNGHVQSSPCYNQLQLNPYFEYGYTPNFTLGLNAFVRQVTQKNQNTGVRLGDVELLTRYRFWHNDYSVFSTQLSFNIPFYRPAFVNPLPPTVSNGQYWLGWRFLYGTGGIFNKTTRSFWYANFEGGYQSNFSGAADQFHVDVSAGWKNPTEKWVLELKSLNTISLHNPSILMAPDYNLSTLAPSVIYQFKPTIGLQVGLNQDIYGTNIGRGTAPFIALWWRH